MKKIVTATLAFLILVSVPSSANILLGPIKKNKRIGKDKPVREGNSRPDKAKNEKESEWWEQILEVLRDFGWIDVGEIKIFEIYIENNKRIEEILDKLKRIEEELDSASDDRREMGKIKEEMKNTLDGISTRVEDIIQKTRQLDSSIRNVKGSLYALADSLDIDLVHIAKDFEDIHKAIAKLDGGIAQLVQRVDSLGVVLVNLNNRIGSLEGRLGDLDGRVDNLEGRVGDLEGRVGDLEGKVDNLEGRVSDLEGRVDNLEGRLDSLESRVSLLEVRLRALEEHVYCRECFSPVSFGAFLSHWYSNQDDIESKPAVGGALLLNFSNRIGVWGEYYAHTITMKNTAETIEWNNHIVSAGAYYGWQPYEQWPFTFKVRSGVGVLAGLKNSGQNASGVSNGSSAGGLLRGEVIFGRYSTKSQFELYGNATLVILHECLELKSTDISKNLDRYFFNFSIGARIHVFGFN